MRKTPLYKEHEKLGAKIIDFGGWLMPVQYTNVIDEHINARTKAVLFDTCHMGEIFIEGADAFKLIQKLVTNDINKLTHNKAMYAAMCYGNGAVVDDLFIYCFDNGRYMVVVNAGNIEKDFSWIKKHSLNFDVNVVDKTNGIAKLDLQGPDSEKILQKLTNFNLPSLERFHFVEEDVNNVKTTISRTGYTAEDGFELYFDSKKAVKIWKKILEAGKEFSIKPAGLGARDTLRLEACYSLYGHELSNEITPLEAGIGFVVKLDKADFIGRDALLKQKENLKRKMVAFELSEKAVPRSEYDIIKDKQKIGYVTSGTFSPTFKKGIGLGLVKIEEAFIGNMIGIKIRGKIYKAKIVKRPFYEFHGKTK